MKPTKQKNIKSQIKNIYEYLDNCLTSREPVDSVTVRSMVKVLEVMVVKK